MDLENKITRFGVYALVKEGSKFLLIEKKSGPYKGLWDLPGGKIEFGEEPQETLQRELKEEVALAPVKFEMVTVLTYNGRHVKAEKPYQFHHLGIIYRIDAINPLADCIPEEVMRWLEPDEIALDALTPFARIMWESKWVRQLHGN